MTARKQQTSKECAAALNNWLTWERPVTPGTATGASLLIDSRIIALKSKNPYVATRELHAGSMPGREGQPTMMPTVV
ncbi:hypothetical protein [Microcoleus sp. D2_18a_D3]|uniref:hypothetical protein n=1 Tax=Microcoleus sp. D2_18a_D3 TaxID=3055330 RepID=UPI002FD30CF7